MTILILLIFVFFLFKIKSPMFGKTSHVIGKEGEFSVIKRLEILNNKQYLLVHNLIIQNQNYSTEIDHIVISMAGIFVIETKNYKGLIYGNENSEYWTQSIYGNRNRFQNPIKQNYSHVLGLKSILETYYPKLKYYPVVVFISKRNVVLKNRNFRTPVIYDYDLLDYIKNKEQSNYLKIGDIERINNLLSRQKTADISKHVSHIKEYIQDKKRKENLLICPQCDLSLHLKKGKYGSFYGCPNYPRCKYTCKSLN